MISILSCVPPANLSFPKRSPNVSRYRTLKNTNDDAFLCVTCSSYYLKRWFTATEISIGACSTLAHVCVISLICMTDDLLTEANVPGIKIITLRQLVIEVYKSVTKINLEYLNGYSCNSNVHMTLEILLAWIERKWTPHSLARNHLKAPSRWI